GQTLRGLERVGHRDRQPHARLGGRLCGADQEGLPAYQSRGPIDHGLRWSAHSRRRPQWLAGTRAGAGLVAVQGPPPHPHLHVQGNGASPRTRSLGGVAGAGREDDAKIQRRQARAALCDGNRLADANRPPRHAAGRRRRVPGQDVSAGAHDAVSQRHLVVRLSGRRLECLHQREQLWGGTPRPHSQARLLQSGGYREAGFEGRVCGACRDGRPRHLGAQVPGAGWNRDVGNLERAPGRRLAGNAEDVAEQSGSCVRAGSGPESHPARVGQPGLGGDARERAHRAEPTGYRSPRRAVADFRRPGRSLRRGSQATRVPRSDAFGSVSSIANGARPAGVGLYSSRAHIVGSGYRWWKLGIQWFCHYLSDRLGISALSSRHRPREEREVDGSAYGELAVAEAGPVPAWVKVAIDAWTGPTGVVDGRVFRPVNHADKAQGEALSEKVVWQMLRPYA